MNIYIYGSKNFKKNINKLLSKANIIFKLDDSGTIVELNSVEELKNTIVASPRDIFLIDEEKIIKKGGVDFLKPKDGIERSFLNKYGVGDLSVDTFDDLIEHIEARVELMQSQQEVNSSISSIKIDNDKEDKEIIEEIEDDALNIDEIVDVDDKEESIDIEDIDKIDNETNDLILDDDIEQKEEINMNTQDIEGLDELDESMLLDALSEVDSSGTSDMDSQIEQNSLSQATSNTISLEPNQLQALTQVLSQLLEGKELEITIKVK